jgi:hypothetical protein
VTAPLTQTETDVQKSQKQEESDHLKWKKIQALLISPSGQQIKLKLLAKAKF